MSRKKRRTINLRDIWGVDAEYDRSTGAYILILKGEKMVIRVHMKYYWIAHVAKQLWWMVARAESIAKFMRRGMEER